MTDERPTPETDACWEDRECNPREHARNLERERDKARNAMAQAQGELDLKTLDFERMREQRDHLLKQLEAERAIADRLAEELEKLAWLAGHEVPNEAEKALTAWKEARSEVKEAKEL